MRIYSLTAVVIAVLLASAGVAQKLPKSAGVIPFRPVTIEGIWLLARGDVQADMKMTPKQKAVADKHVGGYLAKTKLERANTDLSKLEASLRASLTGGQFARLKQLAIQRQSGFALKSKPVASALGITAAQTAKLDKVIQDGLKKHQEAAKKFPPGKYKPDLKIADWIRRSLVAVLTPTQKTKWEAMLGKPMQWSDQGKF